jgi:hypothetical protein
MRIAFHEMFLGVVEKTWGRVEIVLPAASGCAGGAIEVAG